ncbi:hypothetical protein ACQY0O_008190 [Thecaphora frezii]
MSEQPPAPEGQAAASSSPPPVEAATPCAEPAKSQEASGKEADDHQRHGSSSGTGTGSDDDGQTSAAILIQKNYRGYRARRELDGLSLSADSRWQDAIRRLRLQQAHKQAESGQNNSAARWRRGGLLVGQLTGAGDKSYEMQQADDPDQGDADDGDDKRRPVEGGPSLNTKPGSTASTASSSSVKIGNVPGANDGDKIDNIHSIARPNERGLRAIERWTRGTEAQELSKIMEAQYWLEMVDPQHRYGSNLKYYHNAWCEADTDLNFFRWLDHGPGKELDLEECPRQRLDSEKVIYLSTEQRQNYIVDIRQGRLYWRRNGKPVDTAKGKHRDLGEGRGIVDLGPDEQRDEEARIKRQALERGISEDSLDSVLDSTSSSDDEEIGGKERTKEAHHYQSKRTGKKRHLDFLSPSNWADMMLRKTIGSNTWIYVFNHRGELYVGLKQTGYFQHSSFLYGGRVLSAGLLRVDDGQLTSLSPLSGHYRAGTAHFRYFVKTLQDSDVDLSRVVLSKSLLLLAGMEKYGQAMKKIKGGRGGGGGDGQGKSGKKQGDGDDEGGAKKEGLAERVKAHLHLGHHHSRHADGEEGAAREKAGANPSPKERLKDLLIPGHRRRREEAAAASEASGEATASAPPTTSTTREVSV